MLTVKKGLQIMMFNGNYPKIIDLHMHTSVSDGTDTPDEIIERVKQAGIELFSVTDHDAIKGCKTILGLLKKDDPLFLPGVEFSCKDEKGQYHILGYGYDTEADSINKIVEKGHGFRISKLQKRLDYLKKEYGFTFSDEDVSAVFAFENPGKPHLGNLMVKYGYAPSKEEAIKKYINGFHSKDEYIRPEEAIEAITKADGIPVLAHPSYGKGDEVIRGNDMDERLRRLIGYGLLGVEAFYSGFSPLLQQEMLDFAEKYNLYITAGSDYHGKNKLVQPADTNLPKSGEYPNGLIRFIEKAIK